MKSPNKTRRNTRKGKGGPRPIVYLLITVALIGLLFFLLDIVKKPVPKPTPVKPPVAKVKPPPKVAEPEKILPPEKPVKPQMPEAPGKPGTPVPVQKRHSTAVTVPVVKPPKVSGPGTVAIIIDDMGTSIGEVKDLMEIGVPLTFSVIPGLREAKGVAEAAHRNGYEVMIHMPMEPRDYPRRRLESNGLLLSQDDAEIRRRVEGYLKTVPYAIGANNHMGSHFTEDREKMQVVLGVLGRKGLFFVDSKTTQDSVGLALSREMGLRATGRNVFIDNSSDVAAVKSQLEMLAKMAVKQGSAVGICHPHRATITALSEELPLLRSRGIRFVYVSRLVR